MLSYVVVVETISEATEFPHNSRRELHKKRVFFARVENYMSCFGKFSKREDVCETGGIKPDFETHKTCFHVVCGWATVGEKGYLVVTLRNVSNEAIFTHAVDGGCTVNDNPGRRDWSLHLAEHYITEILSRLVPGGSLQKLKTLRRHSGHSRCVRTLVRIVSHFSTFVARDMRIGLTIFPCCYCNLAERDLWILLSTASVTIPITISIRMFRGAVAFKALERILNADWVHVNPCKELICPLLV